MSREAKIADISVTLHAGFSYEINLFILALEQKIYLPPIIDQCEQIMQTDENFGNDESGKITDLERTFMFVEMLSITDDNVFRLTSIAQSLKTLTGDTFIETHSVYKKTLDRWMEKYVSTGKTLSKSVSSTPNLTKTLPLSISESPATIEALPIDDLPVRELKGILPDLNNEQIFAFLQNNRIKCVRDFRLLTPEQVDLMQAKGKQTVYKNAIKRALQKLPESLGQLQ